MSTSPSPWPDACEAAVSLTFDDGMPSQLDRAIPILGEHDQKGTFYINPRGDNWQENLEPWRTVAQAGHEIGNHTVNHPCSSAFKDTRDGGLEQMTLADIEIEIAEGKRRIAEAIPDQTACTFCYPCYHAHVGEGPTRQSYVPVVAGYHTAARGKGDYANHPVTADLHHLYSFPVERFAASEIIGLVEEAVTQNRWIILTFHGIHAGHLSVAEVDFVALCQHLGRNKNRIWTAPVITISNRIISWRKEISM